MAATNCDYKLARVTVGDDGVVTVVAHFYTGEYQNVVPDIDEAAVRTYVREAHIGERRYTFRASEFTEAQLATFMADELSGISALANIPEQARTAAPALEPTARNNQPRAGR